MSDQTTPKKTVKLWVICYLCLQTVRPIFQDNEACGRPARRRRRPRAVYDEVWRDSPVSVGALLSYRVRRGGFHSASAGSCKSGAELSGFSTKVARLCW